MDEERKRIIIITSLLLGFTIIIALIILWFLMPKNEIVNTQPGATTSTAQQTYNEPVVIIPATPERISEDRSYPLGLRQLAMSFAERYGSYSTDEPTKNLDDLQGFMTDSLKSRLKSNDLPENIFMGISSKAISIQLVSLDKTNADILVKVQRTQTIGSSDEQKVFYSDLSLKAVNLTGEWKIDDAAWK